MDINDVNRPCDSTTDTQHVDEEHEHEAALNNPPVDFKSTAEGEKTLATPKLQNRDFQKEAEAYEAVTNILHSFNAFQGTIVDKNRGKFPNDDFYDRTNLVESSRASCASSNFLPVISEPKIITKMHDDFLKDDDDWDISRSEIFTTESSTSGSTTAQKFVSKAASPYDNHGDSFKESNDFDIYQSDIVTPEQLPLDYYKLSKESSPESQLSFSNAYSNNRADYTSSLRASPSNRGRYNSLSRNSHNSGKWFEKMLLQDVKEYFINNPVKVTSYLSEQERMISVIVSPYFSREFAEKYGLSIPSKPIQDFNIPEENSLSSRVLAALELLIRLGISKEDFFEYISLGQHRNAGTNSSKRDSVMIENLNFIQTQVGSDVLSMIYQQLIIGDQKFIHLFHDAEIYDELLSWIANDKRYSPESSSSVLPSTSNSVHQIDDKTSSKKHVAKWWNSPIKGTQPSSKNIKENSRYDKSEKSYEVLENVSNVKQRIRKHSSRKDDKKRSKKIRLQENSNDDKQESNDKEESPKQDAPRNSSQNNWPKKAGENCIIM